MKIIDYDMSPQETSQSPQADEGRRGRGGVSSEWDGNMVNPSLGKTSPGDSRWAAGELGLARGGRGWAADTASEAVCYSVTQPRRGRDGSRRDGPNRTAVPSEKVSGGQTRGLTHVGLMKCM